MKTAIAVPDRTFARVEDRVRTLGMSRSEFFSQAAEHYLDELDRHGLTARINEALATVPPTLVSKLSGRNSVWRRSTRRPKTTNGEHDPVDGAAGGSGLPRGFRTCV